jgi:endonuclease/exonuclease/phosphatase family metal-dependent hydrolase
MERILRWINLSFVVAMLLTYLTPLVNPASVWQFSFIGLGYPVLVMGNIFFVVFWALKKNRYLFFSAATLVAGLGYLLNFIHLSFAAAPPKAANNFTLMTYNVGGLQWYEGDTDEGREQKKQRLTEFAGKMGGADILCVQEAKYDRTVEAVRAGFNFQQFHKHEGTVIFSKFPIVQKGSVRFDDSSNSCAWADIKTPGGTLRVYNVHLESNKMSYTANKIATKGDLRQKQTWRDIRFVLQRYKQGVQRRASQAQLVAEHAKRSSHPVLICGDFNDTPISFAYRVLSDCKQDSFREKGSGIGSTFAGRLPFLRIDYLLADARFRFFSHRIGSIRLSDHYPVWAQVGFRGKK